MQNHTLLTIFGIDLKITATELLVILIVSNTVSLAAVPIRSIGVSDQNLDLLKFYLDLTSSFFEWLTFDFSAALKF